MHGTRRTRLFALFAAVTALAGLAAPVAAQASDDVGLPLVSPPSLDAVPAGFSTNARQAIAVAKTSPVLRRFHRHVHPLQIQPAIWAGSYWFIAFYHRGIVVAEASVTANGKLMSAWTGPQARALYTHGNYAPLFDSPWVLVPFSLLFALPFLGRRLLSVRTLDGAAVLGFLVSYLVFNAAHLEAAVWLAYPPLLYLLGRLLWLGLRGARPAGGPVVAGLDPRWLLAGLAVLVAGREVLSLVNGQVIDVGYASVVGASRIAHGQSLYFTSTGHGDTYGPIAYLAYLPFELLFPWKGSWGYITSAHVASVVFDLVTVFGLVLLGRRLKEGRDGLRLGALLAWGWAACPFTLLAMMEHTNDGLVSMLIVLGLLAFASPAARGALLGLAAAAKFSPAALLGLFAFGRRPSWRSGLICAGCFTLVLAGSIGLYLPSGGVSEFWRHTLGFQMSRVDVFSPWALHPSLKPLSTGLEAIAVLLLGLLVLRPRRRDLGQVCALAGAVTIAVQLPAVHWFYFYIDWFLPFLLVAVLAPRRLREPAEQTVPARAEAGEAPRPVLAPA